MADTTIEMKDTVVANKGTDDGAAVLEISLNSPPHHQVVEQTSPDENHKVCYKFLILDSLFLIYT